MDETTRKDRLARALDRLGHHFHDMGKMIDGEQSGDMTAKFAAIDEWKTEAKKLGATDEEIASVREIWL